MVKNSLGQLYDVFLPPQQTFSHLQDTWEETKLNEINFLSFFFMFLACSQLADFWPQKSAKSEIPDFAPKKLVFGVLVLEIAIFGEIKPILIIEISITIMILSTWRRGAIFVN